MNREDIGYKRVTLDNWLQPDPTSTIFSTLRGGRIGPTTGEDRLRDILEPELNDAVPLDVCRLYEVARGAMAYGYLFYPVYTLAAEQLFRVCEAAVSHKCEQLNGLPRRAAFERKINWLVNNAQISNEDSHRWHNIRGFRNLTSHPHAQMIDTPGQMISMLYIVAAMINALFPS
ncbi:hypothetical protein ANRL2_01966 [Anaerolineae bacterium]|nr:hypothetical protein ANRL2_01966 [Anaerolineae bacterium]